MADTLNVKGDAPSDMKALVWLNIQDLPNDSIAEILDFIGYIRAKKFQPEIFKQAYYKILKADLSELDTAERNHLEEEFLDYKKTYPHD